MSKVEKNKLDEIINLYGQGKKREALRRALIQKKVYPRNSDLLNALGIIFRSLNKLELAIRHYDEAIKFNKINPSFFNNRGNALRDLRKLKEAKSDFKTAIRLKPTSSKYWSNLAKCYNDCDETSKALLCAKKALQCNEDNLEALNSLALASDELGHHREALKSYNRALAIAPNHSTILSNYGRFLFKIERLDEAIDALKRAIHFSPSLVEAHYNLCEVHEKMGNLDLLAAAITYGMEQTSNNVALKLKKAFLQFREKKYSKCIQTLEPYLSDKLSQERKLVLYNLLGKSADKLKDFERAFFYFQKANNYAERIMVKKNLSANRYVKTVEKNKFAFLKATKEKTVNLFSSHENRNLAFLVGFPRSGTTLLDTILRTHSSIKVIEEKPIVAKLISRARSLSGESNIFELSDTKLDMLAQEYLADLKKIAENVEKSKVIIDKFPLNLIYVPFIRKIFPNSKFIIVIRHPCDAVLSCFMQNFAPNDAMANFVSLKQAATLYNAVMSCWLTYSTHIDIDYFQLKYEDLILNFEDNTTELLQFLGLNWEEELKDFNETAMKRPMINTPSYNQVTEKLYSDSCGRWKNYERQFAKQLAILEPWVQHFLYES
ncbi:MAG: sulfotransferase [Pseudomonadota bacterium]|nr:sulfotransferase [Pseudomonadota bacterium]